MLIAAVITIVLFVVALNVAATFRIRNDDFFNDFQRKALIAIVWFVPIMGALFIYIFQDQDAAPSKRRRKGDGLSGYEVVDPALPNHQDHADGEH